MPQVRQTLANSGYVQCGSCRILSKFPLPPASTFRRSCSNTRSPISRRTLSGHDAAASAHHKDTLNTLGCASVPDKHCCCAAASNAEISVAEMHSLQRRDLAFFASCTRENASFGSLFLQAEHSEPPVAVGGFDHVSVLRSLGAVSRSPDAFGSIGAFVAADAAVVGPFCSAASKPRFVLIRAAVSIFSRHSGHLKLPLACARRRRRQASQSSCAPLHGSIFGSCCAPS